LVADAMERQPFAGLESAGVEVVFKPDLTEETLPQAIDGFKVLVVRSTKVTETAIRAGRALGLVVRAGSGTNNIDVKAASAHGVFVSNCPGKNSAAVAELTLGLMIALDRRIPDNVHEARAGRWNKQTFSKARGLKGRVLGLVGFGSIAREVAQRALGFEMDVRAYSRSLTEAGAKDAGVRRATSLEQLLRDSDVVSLHLPLTGETRGLIDRRLIGLLKPGALFVNTARAEIVDLQALAEAANTGRIRVGTDVYTNEPEGKSTELHEELVRIPGVYGTHHIGASTDEAQDAIARETVRIVKRFVETGEVTSAVNLLLAPEVVGTLVVRHFDRVGVLAAVLDTLRKANINVETMENLVFSGGQSACARIRVSSWPGDQLLSELRGLDHVIHVDLV
jgi:D-3-phosphoglycerate dehydrogenase / 2-oxoglutarate reductase